MFACPAPPPSAAPSADRPRYELYVNVHRGLTLVDGRLRVRFTANRDTKRIVFRLWPNGPQQLHIGSRLAVSEIAVDGNAPRTTQPDPSTLVLHRAVRRDASVTITLRWRLRVPPRAIDRIGRWSDGIRLGSFYPILPWDPLRGWITDAPARILAESSTSPTADYDVFVTAPRGFRTLVSGDEIAPGHWRAHAVRDIGLASGRFSVVSGVAHAPRRVDVHIGVADGAQRGRVILRDAISSLQRLSRRYGAYRWSSYTMVATPDLFEVGIEYPTFVFLGTGGFRNLIVAHETAHQWFYSLVGNDQARDPWLDEALASWAQMQLGGGLPPALTKSKPARHVGAPVSDFTGRPNAYFREIYGGGVQALASLGSAARVNCALKLYAARNAYRIAQPRDLLAALDRVIPGADRRLGRFGIHR